MVNIMKIKTLIVILGVIILCSLVIFKKDKEIIKKDNTLSGMIYKINNNDFLLKTTNDVFYTFNNNDYNLNIGDNIIINYTGVLNLKDDIQTVKINKLEKISHGLEYPIFWNDSGIFSAYYEQAYNKLLTLSLEEKIGQLLLVRVPLNNQIKDLKKYNFGGYILFGRDTKEETKDSLTNKIKSYQEASKIPLFIATDEEGGSVVRISNNPNLRDSVFPSSQEAFKLGGYSYIKKLTEEMNNLLESLGINLNLAPVADVSTNEDDYIYKRSFGKNAEETSLYIKTVIESSKNSTVSHVLKHFPGYGNNKDTHTGISIDERSLESFKENDFLPFEAGIKSGVEAIMFSHNIINKVDEDTPASLSLKMHNIARDYLHFTGILMTDDLEMDAIKKYTSGYSVVQAILAGNNMVIISNYEEAIKEIKEALKQGIITEEIIENNVFKILAWKYYKHLL